MESPAGAVEGAVSVQGAELFFRVVGEGPPLFILHGGPEFDQTYLQPGVDMLADRFKLIYYDQRGRGRSTGDAEDVSFDSEAADLDALRGHFGCEQIALLGHSFGGLLALQYAVRYPGRVSRIVLLNTAPACSSDWGETRTLRRAKIGDEVVQKLREIAETEAFRAGDVQTMSEYCGALLSVGVKLREHFERLNFRLEHFGPEGVLRARRIEERLAAESSALPEWDLTPALREVDAPTLVLHGGHDFVPPSCAWRIASSMPNARFVLLPECGHFSYIEQPEQVKAAIVSFLGSVKS